MDMNNKQKKPWYKRIWVWILIILAALVAIGALAGGGTETPAPAAQEPAQSTPAAEEKKPEEKPAEKWDLEAAYQAIQNGMTKQQVEEATGKKSEDCTESDMGEYGKNEICSYGNPFIEEGTITVTYDNGKVSTKTKSTY